MPERRGGTGDAGIADENVELAVALMQRGAEPRDAVEIGEVERHQRGAAAVLADLVVEFLKAALRASDGHDMSAGAGQRTRGGMADAARGAGDERDPGSEGFRHVVPLSSCPGLFRASTSFGGVLQTRMAGTSPAVTENTVGIDLWSADRIPAILVIDRLDLEALPEGKEDKSDQQRPTHNRNKRLNH